MNIKNFSFAIYEGDKAPQAIELYIFDLDKENTSIVTAQNMILRYVSIDDYNKQIINKEQKTELQQLIEKCDIINWKDNYENDEILDGASWSLKFETVDGEKIEKQGLNDFPETFWDFKEGLLDIFSQEYKYYNEGIISFLESTMDDSLRFLLSDIYKNGYGLKSRNIDNAIKIYEENPNDINNMLELANLYYEGNEVEKDISKALDLFLKVANGYNEHKDDELYEIFVDYSVYYKIGCVYYYDEKNMEKAIKFFKKAIPIVKDAYKGLIEIYYKIKDYDTVYNTFIEMNQNNEIIVNYLKEYKNVIVNNFSFIDDSTANFEMIQDNIIDTLINENKNNIYRDLLRILIYYNLSTESNERNNIEVCKEYINKEIFEDIDSRFLPIHPAKIIYNKLEKYIPIEKLNNLLKELDSIIDGYLKLENDSSLLTIDSDEKIKECAENILKSK